MVHFVASHRVVRHHAEVPILRAFSPQTSQTPRSTSLHPGLVPCHCNGFRIIRAFEAFCQVTWL